MSSTLFGIVEELRDTATYYRGKRGVEWLLDRAATEIETLRSELDKVRNLAVGINDETKQLTEERDEARREVCMLASGKGGRSSSVSPDAIEYAQSRGWDCFKKDLTDDNS